MFETVVCNLEDDGYRTEYLGGREYMVCNATIMVEGVHPGSEGPGLYRRKTLARKPTRWDTIHIVNNHPKEGNKFISAKRPGILANIGMGQLFDTKFDKDRIRTKTWIDRLAAEVINPVVVTNIKEKKKTDLSTGMTDITIKKEKGVFNEAPFDWELLEYTADHLAILTDQEGACNTEKGCGLGVANCGCAKKKPLAVNEQSFSAINQQIRRLLADEYEKPGYYWNGYLLDVYDAFFVYTMDSKFYKQAYSIKKDVVSFVGDAEEVVSVTEYRTVNNSVYIGDAVDFVTNLEEKMAVKTKKKTSTKTLDKKTMIANLITEGGFEEEDRKWLEEQSDKKLQALQPKEVVVNEEEDEEPDDDNDDDDDDEEEERKPAKKVNNAKKKAKKKVAVNEEEDEEMDMEEWLAKAPKKAKNVWNEAVRVTDEEITKLIKTIVANTKLYTAEELQEKLDEEKMTLADLRKMAKAFEESGTKEGKKVTTNGFLLPGHTNYALNGTTANTSADGKTEGQKGLSLPKSKFASPFAKSEK